MVVVRAVVFWFCFFLNENIFQRGENHQENSKTSKKKRKRRGLKTPSPQLGLFSSLDNEWLLLTLIYLWDFKPEMDHTPAMFQRILIVLWLFCFKWLSLTVTFRASCQQVFMSLRWSWGSQDFQSWNAHPRQLLCWCWCFRGTVRVPWASPLTTTQREVTQPDIKKKAVTFLLTTFFVNKPPKGKGWSFPYWLVLRTAHGVGQILAMLPSSQLPLDLPCYNPRCLLGMEGGWAPEAWSYSESIKGSLYRAEICSQRISQLASSPVLHCVSVLWQSMPFRRFICKERKLESSNSIAKS